MLEAKFKEAQGRLARYESYQKMLEETGASQLSLTDADARLMKNRNDFGAAYNPQTAVEPETHLIRDFEMTNQVTDRGMLSPTMEGVWEEIPDEILEVVVDKGYENEEDMIKCLKNGIVPHVIKVDDKDGCELAIPFEEAEADTGNTNPKELKKSLHAGRGTEAYKDVISDMKVEEVRRKVKGEPMQAEKSESIYRSPMGMLEGAKTGYFVIDQERNLVYCPGEEILRQKCIKKNGNIRYANKNVCKHCKNRNKCYKGKGQWKEINFTKDNLEKPCKEWLKEEGKEYDSAKQVAKCRFEKVKVVIFF